MIAHRPVRGYLYIGAAAVMWGTLGLAARPIMASGMSPLDAAVWRATAACAVLILYCLLFDRRALVIAWRDVPLFAAYGALSVAGFMTVYFTAIALTTVATAAVLLYTAPVWVVLLARVAFGEPVTRPKAAAVAVAFLGCLLVVGGVGPGIARASPAGVLAGLGAGFTYALYSIFGKVALRRAHSPLTTVVYALTAGAVILIAAARGVPPLRPGALGPILYAALVTPAAAQVLFITSLRWIEAGQAAVVATLEPLVAAIGGALVLREPFGPTQWLGAALVLSGVFLVRGARAPTPT